ncbi:universal stress protein [Streptomyces sp. V3I7]|uniref:universal stress protein n=1 Tax=Streptomyces sp. V3I7 TaxID=3042278 RepID=UPI00278AD0BC|nr:universal stress protein [Streptomyces sp. V3I7]MDQ0989164.1 nucleotide-binding universal stress UspA family protein [Streptomyces sp. V3I7]
MTPPLVVGVDGTDPSLLAVDWAVGEAARHRLPLRLVHASLWERYEGGAPSNGQAGEAERVRTARIVDAAAERAARADPDVKVTVDIAPEEAADALVREGHHAFAVVTGSRGRGVFKGIFLGSVDLAVAARAHCPVIVVRGDRAGVAGSHGRILLGAGDPTTARAAVRFAFREAKARRCALDVVRVWHRASADDHAAAGDPPPAHEQQALAEIDALLEEAEAEHPGVRVLRTAAEGSTRRILLHRSAAADLVIIGARHEGGHRGLRLSLVAHSLLHRSACPVAVVPQPVPPAELAPE